LFWAYTIPVLYWPDFLRKFDLHTNVSTAPALTKKNKLRKTTTLLGNSQNLINSDITSNNKKENSTRKYNFGNENFQFGQYDFDIIEFGHLTVKTSSILMVITSNNKKINQYKKI
jgi:hypothetical protein